MTEMTTRAYADALGTDPKTVRKFLRAVTPREEHPGKGGRWTLQGTKTSLQKDRKRFLAWQKEEADRAAKRAADIAAAAADAVTASQDEDQDPEGTPES